MRWKTLCALFVLASTHAEDSLKWEQTDILTGRHLNALVTVSTDMDGYVGNPTILVMYSPECRDEALGSMATVRQYGLPAHFVTIVKHDYETIRKHIWFDIDSIDDLKSRFIKEDDGCLKVLFFQLGYHISEPFVWQPDSDPDLGLWAWSFLNVRIDVTNKMPYAVKVNEEGTGEKYLLSTIEPGQEKQVNTHFTQALVFYNPDNEAIYAKSVGLELRSSTWAVQLTPEEVNAFLPWRSHKNQAWLMHLKELNQKVLDYKWDIQWKLAESLLITYKQPLMLKRFTKQGYKKTKIPESVFKELHNFYDNNQDKRLSEGAWENMEPNINTDSVQTTMVPLTDEVRESVGGALLETMENWCDCKLEQTAFYGIREYYHGNVLRMHVDNVETHVISSILLIHKEHGSEENWNLEVIDYDGVRRQVSLEEGEMLLYESGTLIHGRPSPYQGRIFANCFLHYRPASDWKWKRYYESRGNPIITDGDFTERVSILNSDFTLREEFKEKDEL